MYRDTHACLASYTHACTCMWKLEVDAGVSPDQILPLLSVFASASWFFSHPHDLVSALQGFSSLLPPLGCTLIVA